MIKLAERLIENGYQVVPISNSGVPLIKGHLKQEFTTEDTTEWSRRYSDAGLALCAGHNDVVALDFDVDDIKLARKLRLAITNRYENVLIRTCNHPRFAVVFKREFESRHYSNGRSAQFKLSDGTVNVIEYLGSRTISMYGQHRKTQNKYRWGSKRNPLDIVADDLDVIPVSMIENLFRVFETHSKGKLVSESTFSRHQSGDAFDNAKLVRKYSDEEVAGMLNQVDGSTRDVWLRVGMGLHVNYDASMKGFGIWDEWSSRFDGYKGTDDLRYHWNTFAVDGGVTLTTINREYVLAKK